MFNNSISVLSRAAARFKKIVLIAELLIQLMFVGYYTYLLVVHRDDLILLIGYSVLTVLGLSIFIVMLFTLDPYQKKVLEFKKYIRRVLRVVSWTGKIIVIGYNVYCLIRFGMTETGHLLLILSIIIFFTEVVLFVASTILSYYYQLFIYALKMDYQRFLGDNQDISEKPIGRVLLNMNDSTDHEDEVNMLFIEQEIYEEVKKYSEKEDVVINRRKIEKQILRYYLDTHYYYLDNNKLVELSETINNIDIDKKELPHLYVLKFFLINAVEKVYYGLADQYYRFVLTALTIYLENKSSEIVEIVYQIVIKSLVGNTDWSKPLAPIAAPKKSIFSLFKNKNNNNTQTSLAASMFADANEIIKKSVEEKEKELKRTVGGEIEGIVSTTIKKKVSGSIKSKIKGFFIKKKK